MEIITKASQDEYNAFVASCPKGHFMQTTYWADVKKMWEFAAVAERGEHGEIIGSLGMLIRKLPGTPFTLIYAPRGPVCDMTNLDLVRSLLVAAIAYAKKRHAFDFKIDPDVLSDNLEITELFLSLGFNKPAETKNFESIQPKYVFRLNVKGKTMDELMASFHQKTRYNIRVAIKNGVVAKLADASKLPIFTEIMEETGMRDDFVTRPLSYFEDMMKALGENCRLYVAEYEGKIVSGTIAAKYGNKVWYLYGASSNSYRNVMPNYLLQYEMIRWAVESGCDIYDFRGVSGDLDPSNHLYGLYKFKKGFNGDFCEFIGEMDLDLMPVVSKSIAFARKAYISVIQVLYRLKNGDKKAPEKKEENND